jgi:hypothetical protein
MLTAERVRELLTYDPETGAFRWKTTGSHRNPYANREEAGCRGRRYRMIGVGGRLYVAHRLAWLLMTGDWPQHQVDHKNGNGFDNRWSNLRSATQSQNVCNRRIDGRNKVGKTGVQRHSSGRWRAYISLSFSSKEEAIEARKKMEALFHGEFVRT